MKEILHGVAESDFNKALSTLGYRQVGSKQEWRRQQFHLFTHKKGDGGLNLSLHEDVPHMYPPFHRARRNGESLRQELNRILEAYRRVRRAK